VQGAMSMHTTESIAHPAVEELELGAVLHALSDPVRLQIVAKLAHSDGDHTCGSFGLPVTKSTCTHHFKVLREAGVIHQRAQGTTRLNRLRREDLDLRFPGLLDTILRAAEAAGHAPDNSADAATLAGITADVAAAMSAGGQPAGRAVA
jgi:DNA-binding transcriptional ArsR family regulator